MRNTSPRPAMKNCVTPEALAEQHWKRRDLPGFMGLAGPLWTRREGDAWAYAVLAQEAHLNPAGVVHGGALVTLLDHAISSVAWEACARQPCLTLQLDTHFVGPVRAGQLAQARPRWCGARARWSSCAARSRQMGTRP